MVGLVVFDTFVAADATALASHTPNLIGTTWVEQVKTGVQSWEINGNEAEGTASESSDACIHTISDAPATAEYQIITRLDSADASGDEPFFLVARFTDSSNYYLCGAWAPADPADKRLHKVVADTVTEIATGDKTHSTADERVRFEVTDARKAMFWAEDQGTPTISSTDNALTSIGIAGIGMGNLVTSTDDISNLWDLEDLIVIDIEDLECFDDFFEPGADVNLISHTADTGEAWTLEEQSGASTTHTETDNSAIESNSEGDDRLLYAISRTLTDAEYQIDVYFNELANASDANAPVWAIARFADTSNFYMGGTYTAANAADKRILKEVSGTVTEIATGDAGFSINSYMTFKVLNATKRIFFNSSEIISSTDDAITAKGKVGIGFGNFKISTDNITAGLDVGLFVVSDIAGAAGADINLSPDQGDLALAGSTPTVAAADNIPRSPAVGDLAFTMQAPTLIHGEATQISPAQGDLVVSSQAPTRAHEDHINRAPAATALTLEGQTPTRVHQDPIERSPAATDLVLDSQVPTRAHEEHVDRAPAAADLVLEGQTPTRAHEEHVDRAPAATDLTLDSQVPTLAHEEHVDRAPAAADLVLEGQAPTRAHEEHVDRAPAATALTLEGQAPTRAHEDPIVRSPAAADLTLDSQAPTFQVSLAFLPDSAELVLSRVAPAIVHDLGMTPATADLVLSSEAPARAASDHHPVAPAAADLAIATVAAAVTRTTGVSVSPGAGNLALDSQAPSLRFIFQISPAAANLILSSEGPEVIGGLTTLAGFPEEHRHPRPKRYILPDGRRVTATPNQMLSILAEFLDERKQAREALYDAQAPVKSLKKPIVVPEVEPRPNLDYRQDFAVSPELALFRDQRLPDDLPALELVALEYFIKRRQEQETLLILLLATT